MRRRRLPRGRSSKQLLMQQMGADTGGGKGLLHGAAAGAIAWAGWAREWLVADSNCGRRCWLPCLLEGCCLAGKDALVAVVLACRPRAATHTHTHSLWFVTGACCAP